MRRSALLVLVFLAACGATVKPTRMTSGRDGAVISCDGLLYTWKMCDKAARKSCPSGYDVVDRQEKKNHTDYGSYTTRQLVVACRQ